MSKQNYEPPKLFLYVFPAQDICTVSCGEEGNALEFDIGNLDFQ